MKVSKVCLAHMLVNAVLLVSCTPRLSTVLIDSTCLPPCWHKIIPGHSTKQDVLSLLPTLPEVNANSIKDAATVTNGLIDNVYWLFTSKAGDIGGRIHFVNDKVSVIEIEPKDGSLTFADAIKKLGEPENVLAFSDIGDSPRLIIYVLYPENGYALLYYDNYFPPGENAQLKSMHSVQAIYYFDQSLFEEIMTQGPIAKLDPNLFNKGMQPWTGFGEITYIDRNEVSPH